MRRPSERGRELERPVVAGPEAGMPVGLVEAEHEGPRDAVAVHGADQLLVAPDHPVDVRAEVGVGVEDLEVGGEIGAQTLVPRRQRPAVPARAVIHCLESTASMRADSVPTAQRTLSARRGGL